MDLSGIPVRVAAIAVLILVLVVGVPAHATHPLITDDAETQGTGHFELELNGSVAREDDEGEVTRALELETGLTVGLTRDLDAILTVPYGFERTAGDGERGVFDLKVDLKWRYYDGDGLALSLKPGITVPTGDEERAFGSGRVGAGLFQVVSVFAEPWALHFNFGYRWNPNALEERQHVWHASVASELHAMERLHVVANVVGERNPDGMSEETVVLLLGGVVYTLNDYAALDAGILHAPTGGADYSALFGITLRL